MTNKEFLINNIHGGFGYSQAAVDEYNKRMLELDPTFTIIRSQCPDYQDIPRDNPIMIQIMKDAGINVNDKWASLQIISIPEKYYIAVEIENYEGFEWWRINFEKYKLHKIEQVLFSSIPDYEKISKIYSIICANITIENFSSELNT